MYGNTATDAGIKRLFFVAFVFVTLHVGEAFHESFFNGLQEIDLFVSMPPNRDYEKIMKQKQVCLLSSKENVQIVHRMIHRSRRQILSGSRLTPDLISTEIQTDAQKVLLKFRRKWGKTLSPVLSRNKTLNKLATEKTTANCTYFYDDISSSAHAIVDKCEEDGKVKMVAEVVLDNQIHVILPKGKDNSGWPQQHALYKVNSTINFQNDYSKLPVSNNDKYLPNVNHRLRRETERTYMELMFVVDYSLYKFWYDQTAGTDSERQAEALGLIQRMYAFIGNGVNLRYGNLRSTFGVNIDVELTTIYVLKTPEESVFTEYENVNFDFSARGVVDAETLLNAFKFWVQEQKDKNPTTFTNNDHYMLLTAREIVLSGNAAAAGYAYYTAVCTDESVSIAEDKFNFLSVVTASHEIGHSLGGVHDGDTGNVDCKDEDGYILSAINAVYTDTRALHPWQFSLCSANSFATTLRNLQASGDNCLKRDDTSAVLMATGSPPGQVFPPDEQCKLMFDLESVMWRQRHVSAPDDICTAMACTQQSYSKLIFVIPGDGTTCGDKKWCWNGKCLFSEEAPSSDNSCLYGDQRGTVIDGSTCESTLAGDNKWKCYQTNIRESCCATCKDKHTGIEGCDYGDKDDCGLINPANCYKPSIELSCCETCSNFALIYVNSSADCRYGDKKANCVRTSSTCSQFYSDCCATCHGFETPSTPSTSPTVSTGSKSTRITQRTERPSTAASTEINQERTTVEPMPEEKGLPEWVIPAAGGAGGLIVLTIIIGICCKVLGKSTRDKYKENKDKKRKRSNEDHRRSDDKRQLSDDNRRRSNETRRKSGGNLGRVDDNRKPPKDSNRRMSNEVARLGPPVSNSKSGGNLGRVDDNRKPPKDSNRRMSNEVARLGPPVSNSAGNLRRGSADVRSPRHYERRRSEGVVRHDYKPSAGRRY